MTPLEVNFPCIYSVAEIHRQSIDKKSGKTTKGQRLYLSSRSSEPPSTILQKIRERWSIENKNHHPRDASLLEDKCRCRTGNTAANLALLRGVVLLLWKKTRPKRTAADFIRLNQKNLDAQIALLSKNQRLKSLE